LLEQKKLWIKPAVINGKLCGVVVCSGVRTVKKQTKNLIGLACPGWFCLLNPF
jgi:hypothetical protein